MIRKHAAILGLGAMAGVQSLAAPGELHAAPVPPPTTSEEIIGPPSLTFKPAVAVHMGSKVVHFEQTRLADIAQIAGDGRIAHQGDGGASVYWLCFTQTNPNHTDRLWLMSSVMGGNDHAVTEVVALRLPRTTRPEDGCPQLPPHLSPISLDRGVWLGTPERAVRSRFKKPSSVANGWETFYFSGKVSAHQGDGKAVKAMSFDVTNVLEVRIESEAVSGLRAIHVTTN